jgi:hypothetical protein
LYLNKTQNLDDSAIWTIARSFEDENIFAAGTSKGKMFLFRYFLD